METRDKVKLTCNGFAVPIGSIGTVTEVLSDPILGTICKVQFKTNEIIVVVDSCLEVIVDVINRELRTFNIGSMVRLTENHRNLITGAVGQIIGNSFVRNGIEIFPITFDEDNSLRRVPSNKLSST